MASTREEILNESLDLFAKKGYYGTSMREIAKAVGIKGSSIYNHFNGKEDIFGQLFNYLAPLNLKSEEFQSKFMAAELDPIAKIPKQIVINEAVELAKIYCDSNAYKLINGVLANLEIEK